MKGRGGVVEGVRGGEGKDSLLEGKRSQVSFCCE